MTSQRTAVIASWHQCGGAMCCSRDLQIAKLVLLKAVRKVARFTSRNRQIIIFGEMKHHLFTRERDDKPLSLQNRLGKFWQGSLRIWQCDRLHERKSLMRTFPQALIFGG